MTNLTPVQVCTRLFGSREEIARIVGGSLTVAYNWEHPSSKRDAGDLPSTRIMRSLLAHAAARGIPLTADHLIWGASEDEIAAVLTARAAPTGLEAAE